MPLYGKAPLSYYSFLNKRMHKMYIFQDYLYPLNNIKFKNTTKFKHLQSKTHYLQTSFLIEKKNQLICLIFIFGNTCTSLSFTKNYIAVPGHVHVTEFCGKYMLELK